MGVTINDRIYDVSFKKGVALTAATIAFVNATKKITDSGDGLAIFETGDILLVDGSIKNDGYYTVTTGGVDGEIVVAEALVEEPATATVTLTATVYGMMTVLGATEFRRRANDFAPVIGVPGAQLEYAEDVWRPWTMSDFRGGLGQEEWADPTRFFNMTPGLRIYKNRITLDTVFVDEDAGVILTKGVDFKGNHYAIDQTGSHKDVRKRASLILTASSISFDSGTKEIRDDNNGLAGFKTLDGIVISGAAEAGNNGYKTILTGGVAAKIVVNEALTDEAKGQSVTITGWWSTVETVAGRISDICVYGDNLWICTDGDWLYYSADGSAWTQRTKPQGVSWIRCLLAYRQYLWGAYPYDSLWFSDDPATGPDWKGGIDVGDKNGTFLINGLAVIGGIIAIGRSNGIYTYEGSGNRAEGPIIDFENMTWEGNCKTFFVADGFLYYNVGNRLKRTDLRGAEFDVTPVITGTTNYDRYGFGVPVGGVASQGHAYVAFDNAYGTFGMVLEMPTIDIGGWRIVFNPSSAATMNGLWFSDVLDRLLVNNGTTRTQRFQAHTENPYPDFVTTAHIITSWFDAGDVWSKKIFAALLAYVRLVTADQNIKIYYEADYSGAWTLIGTFVDPNQRENQIVFDPTTIAISARKLRLKIELNSAVAADTPVLELPLVTSYVVRPDPTYAQQVLVRLHDNIRTHDGKPVEQSAATLKAFLRACEAYEFPLEYTDRDGNTWDVFLSRTEELRQFMYEDQSGNRRQEDVMVVTMKEV